MHGRAHGRHNHHPLASHTFSHSQSSAHHLRECEHTQKAYTYAHDGTNNSPAYRARTRRAELVENRCHTSEMTTDVWMCVWTTLQKICCHPNSDTSSFSHLTSSQPQLQFVLGTEYSHTHIHTHSTIVASLVSAQFLSARRSEHEHEFFTHRCLSGASRPSRRIRLG